MSADLFHGLSHVDVPVSDLERALALYSTTLGFPIKKRGDGWAELEGAASRLRLLVTRRVEHPVTLRVSAPDVAKGFQALVAAGARELYAPMRTPEQELLSAAADADGNTIIVWRELTEDEYASLPELPKELRWQPDAEAFLKSLLLSVPALFRAIARWRVVRVAEELAEATRVVTKGDVTRAFILSSAKVTRHRVRKPLADHGVDLARYAQDFDA